MNRFFLLLQILVLTLGLNTLAQAKGSKTKNKKPLQVTKNVTQKDKDSQLGTTFSFEAASVRGKYQTAGQGIAMVEDEKVLDDLLGLRRSFKDRENQEASRR
ncbi:hypothetical protein K2X05_03615 [bacterium]|nr:hypothetical protein [bacterium]